MQALHAALRLVWLSALGALPAVGASTMLTAPASSASLAVGARSVLSPSVTAPLAVGARPVLSPSVTAELMQSSFVRVPEFISPALVDALVADVDLLRARHYTSEETSMAHGSVEWLPLLPVAPPIQTAARERLLALVAELQASMESCAGISLDADVTDLKYVYYPCGGYYPRHTDATISGDVERVYSFILYLNQGWSPTDGGKLRAWRPDGSHVDVAPTGGTLVVFKSDEVPHEVLATTSQRVAVVGWLCRRRAEPEPVDESELSPLARAILEHYREQGQAVKV